jgi:hypothetical protein
MPADDRTAVLVGETFPGLWAPVPAGSRGAPVGRGTAAVLGALRSLRPLPSLGSLLSPWGARSVVPDRTARRFRKAGLSGPAFRNQL